MVKSETQLPKWLKKRYSTLWKSFGSSNFKMDDAVKTLGNSYRDDKEEVRTIISELRRAGWLSVELDSHDTRKRQYILKSKEEIIDNMFDFGERKLTRGEIEKVLKKAADLIRTRVDYKFILILLFLKRISDKWELEFRKEYNKALEDGLGEVEAKKEARNPAYHDFDIPEEYLWENIRKDVKNLPEKLSKAMKSLADRNPELKDILANVDFIEFAQSRENAEILRQLIELFSERRLHNVSPDILGDAYEWILSYFAPTKAKEGEVYTPREVISLLVEILDPKPGESVYDPASASNGMLILSYDHVKDNYNREQAEKLFLYGQEANYKTLALGRMNLYIHDIKNAHVEYGDTLLYPKFKRDEGIEKFDIIIANPPWNQDGYPEETLKKGEFWRKRFSHGFVPKQSADWAWIQHMLASAKDDGRVGVVIDNGCLFRGGKEKAIRERILENDLIECVILLPEKLFYNTGAPGAVVIFNKAKPENRKGKVLFINASKEYEQHPEVRKLNRLGEEHIEAITKAYREFTAGDGFARPVPLDEIKENDYNLNVTLYVFPEEEVEDINVTEEWREVKNLENDLSHVDEKIENYLEEIYHA